MRSLLFLLFSSFLAVWPVAAQDSYSEEDFQSTLALAIKFRDTNFDSSVTVLSSALDIFDAPHQKIELLNQLGRTYELKRQLDSALIVLEEAELLAKRHNREDFLVSILFNIGYTYNTLGEKQKSINYLHQSNQLAVQQNDLEAQYEALSQVGRTFSSMPKADSASVYLHKALDLIIQLGDKKEQAWVLMVLGNNSARSNQIDQAMEYYNQSIEIAKEINDLPTSLYNFSNIGYTYAFNGNFPLALEYYNKGLEVAEKMGSASEQASMSIHLAYVYTSLKELDQALFYYEKADQLWAKEGNANERKLAFEKKGEVYLLKGDYRQAINQYLQSSQMIELTNRNLLEPSILINMGTCYEKLNLLDSAKIYYDLAINIAGEGLSHKDVEAEGLAGLASIYLTKGALEVALSNAQQAFSISMERENDEMIMKVSELLYRINKSKGNNSQALQYFERFHILQDSLFSRQKIRQIAQLEVQNQFDRQKQQLEFERQQERERARSRQLFILIIAGSLALFLLLTYRNVLSKIRANTELQALNEQLAHQHAIVEGQKKELEELDQVKSRFFTNISHEFRTPLTVIGGMVEQIEKSPSKWLSNGLQLIKRNNNNLLYLINQILDLRKLESGILELDLVQADIIYYLKYIFESFQALAENKDVKLHFLADETTIVMDYDQKKLSKIISNLLSNAIKFTPRGGDIYLRVDRTDAQYLSIKVTDTGIGIPEDKLPHIFDRFYQVDNASTRKGEGTGIGLALIKELLFLMDGRIEVTSPPGKGSSFEVVLPMTRNAPKVSEQDPSISPVLTSFAQQVKVEENLIINKPETAGEKPTLLIIEDNPDVVEYLVAILQDAYQLSIARDGQEGINQALEQIPDLIISDVMMPEKDGYEVCEALKTNVRTSHIPIILLTAKSDDASRITGLKRGADAYLSKPFNEEELFVRMQKLLELRQALKERYRNLTPVAPSTDPGIQQEDAFMEKVRTIVESRLDDETFSIPDLCKAMAMSRSHLHLKIKALTDRPTTHLIRAIRLKKARELFETSDLNVTEVALEVGFKDPAYFSRIFASEFGVPPSEFMKQTQSK